jgi:hypothetical protein
VYFVLLAAALAILGGVVAVAMGRGGEMAEFSPDRPATAVRVTSAADIVRLRLPLAVLGYEQRAADQALHSAAVALAQREAEIARLRAGLAWPGRALAPPAPPQSPASAESSASPEPPAPRPPGSAAASPASPASPASSTAPPA